MHSPFFPFVYIISINFPFVCFPSFRSFSPHSFLFATKDDASDKTDGKIISLCFSPFLSFSHSLIHVKSIVTVCGWSAPCCQPNIQRHWAHLSTKFIIYFTIVSFLIWKWSNNPSLLITQFRLYQEIRRLLFEVVCDIYNTLLCLSVGTRSNNGKMVVRWMFVCAL